MGQVTDDRRSEDDPLAGVAQLLAIARAIIRVSAQSLLETDHPGLLTSFERSGRVAAHYIGTLQSWSDRLRAPVTIDDLTNRALEGQDLEARAAQIDAAERRILQMIAMLLPRTADHALREDLVKLRDLYVFVRDQPAPFIGTETSR